MIIRNNRGQVIGDYDTEHHIFTKQVQYSKHFYRKLKAWCIDAELFNLTLLPDNALIVIFDKENKMAYRIHAREWFEWGEEFQYEGYERQTALALEHFRQTATE